MTVCQIKVIHVNLLLIASNFAVFLCLKRFDKVLLSLFELALLLKSNRIVTVAISKISLLGFWKFLIQFYSEHVVFCSFWIVLQFVVAVADVRKRCSHITFFIKLFVYLIRVFEWNFWLLVLFLEKIHHAFFIFNAGIIWLWVRVNWTSLFKIGNALAVFL